MRVTISGMAPREFVQGDALAPAPIGLNAIPRLTHCISHVVSGDD
ncbi:hypothetical protein ACFSQT_27260 [Mesorhizobium calcicola]|uniref:Uncharacterized protein n=1 Tax=Mesorhizobium calcicola TaxID=1300310 RepID=A0ABW4WM67_9HYPH